ncbi:Cell division and transport-associated protein TolR [Cognatiyoonia koreensis]|uniref:Cell division and transport-associated protein TolR n=1 Tax=Cognatiyoonia koreensis TaxID=364200 RepID=A0A1I0MMA9_9RHOB|nr:ExbD/TolR family protein [Cognatiyoonia koreensis]SEV89272.1 Cell division and transport-associated protein TolR [Cognatiyoonia koreensis]
MGAGVMKSDNGGGTRRRRRSRRGQPMSEINVTPFVDVMLVLLIIFMVAAPLSIVGPSVELPETAADAFPSDDEEPLTVTILADGSLTIQDSPTAESEFAAKLQAIATEREGDRVFLRADGANDWNRVAQVMGALNSAGFSNIGLVTDIGGPTFNGSDG